MFPGSIVKDNLWNLVGVGGIAFPIFQILAGLSKIVGIARNKSNIEAFGLIMVASLFMIRAITLVTDGDVTLSDINNVTIAIGIIVSNLVRLSQLLNGHKYLVTELSNSVSIKEDKWLS